MTAEGKVNLLNTRAPVVHIILFQMSGEIYQNLHKNL